MQGPSISHAIRKRRLELGLSLADLARRAGTSAAALSRYEHGWQRFEVATLRKIATALACRLEIRLEPAGKPRRPLRRARAVKQLSRLFWDHALTTADVRRYSVWVAERILEYGSLQDVHTLMAMMEREQFVKTVAQCRFRSARTRQFWRRMLEQEGIPCTTRSFPRGVWNF